MPFSKIKNDSRLKALKETQLLDTPPDYKFDRFTQLVTTILDVPVCLFSLVTPDRQFFKSQSGLNEPWSVLRQTPLSHSFCRHVVETDQSLIVEDARVHPLLKNNPAITSLSVVAYAGFPISTPEGFVLGSFCAIDDKPRKWSIRDVAVMKGFTEAIESEIGLQLELHRRKRAEERLRDESERYRVKLEAEVTSRTAELLAALARSQAVEERFETLMKRTPQAIAMFDRNLCYLHYSERWIEDYRLQAQLPLTGRCHYDVFPTIPERWKAHHRRALTGESLSNQEDSFLREDGSREWLRWELVPWREANGEIGGLIMLTEVMTQRRIEQAELRQMKHLERQLREAQKMGTLGLLAGGLAHDLNNILCGILLPAEMSKHELPSSHPLQDDLTTIYEAGRRAERLVKQLLVFTRRQPTEPKVVDVNQVVENFRGILSRLLPKRIQLHVNLPATPLPKVMIDPSALEQVILNLVVNAKDAMPEGGTVSIEVEVQDTAPQRTVVLCVVDSGIGLPEGAEKQIFEPFFTTKALGEGTGLGLSVCANIIKDAGGTISAESSPGRGTRFRVEMPYDESSLDCSEEVGHEVVGGNERILLVEEDDAIRNLTSKFLVTLGYRVEHLGSPSEALESIRETPFDLLISEIHLPGMDGREFASECRMTQPALRTILVSGDTSSRESSTNLIGETHSFLPKPFTTTQLAKRIREALD